ncbi:hypothetical protein KR032_006909 [Drosophila birchii]|nr:hypothetical protein KR032_006909 [Drosophila birchii]
MAKLIVSFIFLSLLVTRGWSVHRFETDIIRKLSAENADTKNFVISPFAIHQALTMLYFEKDKKRDYQLAKVLRITGKPTDKVLSYISKKHTSAKNQEFIMANQIYYPDSFKMPGNIKKLSTDLRVDVAKIRFSNDEKAGEEITKWLSKSITQIYPKLWDINTPTNNTKFVAVQGLLVEPKWKYPFDWLMWKNFTILRDGKRPTFHSTKMMYGTGPFASFLEDDVRGVSMPFSKGDITMIIFMHTNNQNNNNQAILENLNKYLRIQMKENTKVHLYIPILMFDNTLDLGKSLESFGLKKVFGGKIPTKGNLTSPIFKQLCALKVNPLQYQWEAEYPEDDDNKVIIVDQPFVFVIKDSSTIYMAGRVDTLKGTTIPT